ncbi:recombinase family protein [Streptomyces sp. NPDC005202]|uniref:recombinase family protein n=1 Tax=Streptomyces sp. NPDC005202 TaxID=3157021 RepID=UPI0033B8130F
MLSLFHNPCYAGVFVYGRRRGTRTTKGKAAWIQVPRDQWDTMIPDHHEGYLSLEQWEANQRALPRGERSQPR